MSDARVARLKQYFESLDASDVARIGELYAADAQFRDPFNDVRGLDALTRIFEKMFEDTLEPRFAITHTIEGADEAVLVWDFTFRLRRYKPDVAQRIHGLSHVRFDASGKVTYHRDYWDAASELYEKLPVVGGLMRYLKRRIG